jgi:hypothetical protein
MLTTLRTGALTLTSAQYKFEANKRLTIKLTTTGNHLLYGDVNITLANVLDINIYDKDRLLVEDYFNATFLFSRTGAATLEYSVEITSGIDQSLDFATLTNNGSAITATVANASINLGAGSYNFALLDTSDSEFSTSTISVKQLNLGNTGLDGVESVFDELGEGDFLSINGEDLTFDFTAQVSIKDNDAGTTNIPILITSNYGRR